MRATAAEHEMSLLQAIKTYKKAALWSILMSTSIVMEGYDTVLVSSFIGYPAFRQKYGVYHNEESGYQISSSWQAALSVCGSISNILGALLNGYFTGKYGHRFVSMTSLIGLTAFIFIVFFSPNLGVLLAGQFLCGISWGVFATSGPSYAAEVSPLALRGHLTSYANLCWTIGQFISAGVLRALVDNTTEWGYRIPFAVQWVWPVPLFLIALFAPESPWYLVRVGKIAEAKKALMRLSEPEHNVDYDAAVALMVHTDKMEKENTAGTSYLDAFRGTNRRRTEIACMLFLSQVADGSAFAYSATFFFEQAGISATASYGIGLGGTGIAFVGTLISWLYIGRFGRRTIWLWGFCLICTTLLLIGILASVKETLPVSYAQAVLCLIWLGGYSMSVGPIVYAIVSEIGSTRLRIQTIVLGRSTYYLGGIFAGVIEPYFMSPTAWNLQGKTAFVWFGTAFLMTLWGYFRLPETKGRTFGEMEYLFKKRIPARKFGSFEVDEREEFQC
ncbi:general substrate transporter [Aspergillus pseudoustus]|uniref:General substrate transporter n=1 Tax=Aspergillus pseudoustus TaxID=1810923 RepID=A0ABR4JKK0_9EURO